MVRSKGRSGLNPRAYLGVEAPTPPNIVLETRAPNATDSKNFNIGDLWLHYKPGFPAPGTNEDIWMLIQLERDVAKWVQFGGDGGDLETLTGNLGGAVSGDAMDNINTIGDGVGITVTGNPGTNTLTWSLVGGGVAAQTFVTDSGTASPNAMGALNVLTNFATQEAGSTVLFSAPGAANTILLSVTDGADNTLIGFQSGNALLTGVRNTGLGNNSLIAITSADDSVAIGAGALFSLTSGTQNTAVGSSAVSLVNTGANNTALGYFSLGLLDVGSNNVCVGRFSGSSLTGASSDNINIGTNTTGAGVESNTIRIGSFATQTRNFQAGIAGVALANQQVVYIDSTTGQLGSYGPAMFDATNTGTAVNQTGDGTQVAFIYDIEQLDVGNVYDPTTGRFTTPVNGNYYFVASLELSNIGAGHTLGLIFLRINLGGSGFFGNKFNMANVRASDNTTILIASGAISLTAGQVIDVVAQVSNSTKTIGLGGGMGVSHFHGFLIGPT